LNRIVAEQEKTEPHLIPIGERAEEIRRHFEERLISAREALQDLEEVVRQLQTAQEERRSSPLSRKHSPSSGGCALRASKRKRPPRLRPRWKKPFTRFPNWSISVADERELRTRLYKALMTLGVQEVVAWANRILDLLRRAAE
jgi:hypothetical protein